MTTAVPSPLHDPERDSQGWTPPLDVALRSARDTLAQTAATDIHDHHELIKAAASLDYVLRDLVAALDAEAAR
ncbi:hypothetical protein [Streptomyces sp. NPDC059979]|uniref:hypothetical protein n=1 Tax=Streptomyces sp. NPDC059979 TaxID=3347021 RepID=UPI0036AD8CF8